MIPFSLDITGVDPDFNRTIEVYNNSEIIANNTETMDRYVFSPENPDPSVFFEFFVTAVNEMGLEGEPGEPVRGCFLGNL